MDITDVDYTESIQLFAKNPKAELMKRFREVEASKDIPTEGEKKAAIKKILEQYMVDYEMYCFEEAWSCLQPLSLPAIIRTLALGLEHTFSKRVGPVSFEWRRVKLLKYLEKK